MKKKKTELETVASVSVTACSKAQTRMCIQSEPTTKTSFAECEWNVWSPMNL